MRLNDLQQPGTPSINRITGVLAPRARLRLYPGERSLKLILTGTCGDKSFVLRTDVLNPSQDPVLKILEWKRDGVSIACMGYGPYDNGYLILGTSNGDLRFFDPVTLNKLRKVSI